MVYQLIKCKTWRKVVQFNFKGLKIFAMEKPILSQHIYINIGFLTDFLFKTHFYYKQPVHVVPGPEHHSCSRASRLRPTGPGLPSTSWTCRGPVVRLWRLSERLSDSGADQNWYGQHGERFLDVHSRVRHVAHGMLPGLPVSLSFGQLWMSSGAVHTWMGCILGENKFWNMITYIWFLCKIDSKWPNLISLSIINMSIWKMIVYSDYFWNLKVVLKHKIC